MTRLAISFYLLGFLKCSIAFSIFCLKMGSFLAFALRIYICEKIIMALDCALVDMICGMMDVRLTRSSTVLPF